jgi:hypothetical protein
MSPPDPVRAIADAVLYEGYVLWPYRRSALKNTRRFTFGGVHPPAHAAAHPDDAATMRTEVLVEGGPEARVDVEVRFLHVVRRQVFAGGKPVDELVVDGERFLSWEEAAERTVTTAAIDIPAGREEEGLAGDGAIVRSWDGLTGTVTVDLVPIGPDLRRLTVEIANTTPFAGEGREAALACTFCSTHTVLRGDGAAFVSATDPPAELAAEAAACRNERTWPVLVGEPGDRGTMLSSPIILEDYPRIAPESPGDLFDGGEIDQLLTLNILTLTDEEKEEMRASDPRAREILERTEALTPEQLMRLHGTVRELQVRP